MTSTSQASRLGNRQPSTTNSSRPTALPANYSVDSPNRLHDPQNVATKPDGRSFCYPLRPGQALGQKLLLHNFGAVSTCRTSLGGMRCLSVCAGSRKVSLTKAFPHESFPPRRRNFPSRKFLPTKFSPMVRVLVAQLPSIYESKGVNTFARENPSRILSSFYTR